MKTRFIEKEKLRQIHAQKLADLCAHWDFWPLEQTTESLLKQEYQLLVIFDDGDKSQSWQGALLSYHGMDTTDIIYLYVQPKSRGHGLATQLLASLWAMLSKDATMQALFLEVRKSNLSAIRVYRNFGMKQVGERKKYYRDGEDALVFSREIKCEFK